MKMMIYSFFTLGFNVHSSAVFNAFVMNNPDTYSFNYFFFPVNLLSSVRVAFVQVNTIDNTLLLLVKTNNSDSL